LCGTAHHKAGRLPQAEECYRAAIAADRRNFAALHQLGVCLNAQGKPDECMQWIRRALVVKPDQPAAYNNLGNALQALERFDEAAQAYRRAVSLKPDYAMAYYNLGVVLQAQNRWSEAVEAYSKAVKHQPGYVEAYVNLGNTAVALHRPHEAIACYHQALRVRPSHAEAYNNLGIAFEALHRPDDAAEAYRRALRLEPSFHQVKPQLVYQLQQLCDWRELDARILEIRRLIEAGAPVKWPCFGLLGMPGLSEADHRRAAEEVARQSFAIPHGQELPRSAQTESAPRRLRVGYLSSDFRDHALARLMTRVFELHDRRRFEIIAYSYGPRDGSEMRRRLEHAFDEFKDISPLANRAAADQIRVDGIDILVDLQGHARNNRLEILAYRPALIQATYLGYPGTLGAPFVDYLIADRFVIPEEQRIHYTETVAYLPDCYQPNDNTRPIGETPERRECGLPEQGFVFCCFNQPYKITPSVFDVWCRLLRAVDGSVVWLMADSAAARDNLRNEAARRRVDPNRLVFASKLPQESHLARLQWADLALDTLPYGSHTTGSDALWVGVPLLTCVGETFAGRVGGSLLLAVDLPELITHTVEDYFQQALRLATEREELRALRGRLVRHRETAPLFDSGRFTRNLEDVYRELWKTSRQSS
jgi:predicted O-linked N-acetylglucosamine transferase (SPINDLY family)